jgi:hypothetical protein
MRTRKHLLVSFVDFETDSSRPGHGLDAEVYCTTPTNQGCKLVRRLERRSTFRHLCLSLNSRAGRPHSEPPAQYLRILIPTMGTFDANRWYQINLLNLFDKRSMVGQPPQSPNTTGNVFFKLTEISSKGRLWQLHPVDDTRYILRSKSSSPDTYLAIQNDADTAKGSIATMRNVSGAHDEIF